MDHSAYAMFWIAESCLTGVIGGTSWMDMNKAHCEDEILSVGGIRMPEFYILMLLCSLGLAVIMGLIEKYIVKSEYTYSSAITALLHILWQIIYVCLLVVIQTNTKCGGQFIGLFFALIFLPAHVAGAGYAMIEIVSMNLANLGMEQISGENVEMEEISTI